MSLTRAMPDGASVTILVGEHLQKCGGSGGGVVGSNSSGASPRTRQVMSAGLTSFSTSARAALRQPVKSVSLSRVMKCIGYSLYILAVILRCALLRASKDGPRTPSQSSFEARKGSHLRMTTEHVA